MKNAGLGDLQTGLKTARRNFNNLRYADDSTLMSENEEKSNDEESNEEESLLMKVKMESGKS